MKTIFTSAAILISVQIALTQEFQFTMYFEDAAANKDSLIIGYDSTATNLIDEAFGEENILDKPLDTLFEVRIMDPFENYGEATFHTKKQVVPDNCLRDKPWQIVTIGIKSNNWPVTASWDSTLFNIECREGSVFTSLRPGGWWDVTSVFSDLQRIGLASQNSVTFSSNLINNGYDFPDFGSTHFEDTLSHFWLAFGDSNLIKINIEEEFPEFKIYPNPATDYLYFEEGTHRIKTIQLINSAGQISPVIFGGGRVPLTNKRPGIYFIIATTTDDKIIKRKLLKL